MYGLGLDRRDPWEPTEAAQARKRKRRGKSDVSADPFAAPRAINGRAPERVSSWRVGSHARSFDDREEVDFAVVGTGAGGGPVLAGLAEQGFRVVGFDAGPYFRPLEDFASDETEQEKLYWNDDRISEGENPLVMGGKNSGKAVGGSTVHFAMVSLRFRPEWFKSRTHLATAPIGRSTGARCGNGMGGPKKRCRFRGR